MSFHMKLALFFVILSLTASCFKSKSKSDVKKAAKSNQTIDVFYEDLAIVEIFDPKIFAGRVEVASLRPIYSAISGVVTNIYQQPGKLLKSSTPILKIRPIIGVGFQEHVVMAPIDGYLSRLGVEVGEKVEANIELGAVAKLEDYQTTIQVTYEDIVRIKKGQQVELSMVDRAGLTKNLQGIINSVSIQPEPTTNTYQVKIDIPCENFEKCREYLKLGAFIRVALKYNPRQGFRIKSKYFSEDRRQLLVVLSDNIAQWVDVELGQEFGEYIEVTKGLEEPFKSQSKLVTSYSKRPSNGDKLRLISVDEAIIRSSEEDPVKSTPNKIKGNTKNSNERG